MKKFMMIVLLNFAASTFVSAQIYTDVEPENALNKFNERVAAIRFPNELEMLVLDTEDYFARNPSLENEFLHLVYSAAFKRTKNAVEMKFFNQRLVAAKSADLNLTNPEAMIARLQVLETEKQKSVGSPYTQPDSQMKMIFIAAGRAFEKSNTQNLNYIYIQGRSQHASLRGGRQYLEMFLERTVKTSPYFKDAKARLADIKQKDGDVAP